MTEALADTLRAHFGFPAFRPGQAEAVAHVLAGRHTLAVMPTGSGKSLIYQLAALHSPGVTLVISPLIALMKDQVDSLERRGIPATYINSSLPPAEQDRRLLGMAEGVYRLVYVAPERLRSVRFQQALDRVRVGLLAVDEAHCISQWGHDFRPDYMQIGAARGRIGNPVTVALTATATSRVQDDIVRLLEIPSAERLVVGFNRPNICFEVRAAPDLPAKLRVLRDLLASLHGGAAIVYTGTRYDAEEVAEFIRVVAEKQVRHYHAGMESESRDEVQEAFLSGELPVIAATNAFGMGIDRSDVRLVVHFSLPGTVEAYYQEAGRAGRDGAAARAVLLYDPEDRSLQENLITSNAPSGTEVSALYDALLARGSAELSLTPEELSEATGLRGTQVRLALARLESAGVVQRLGDQGARLRLRLEAWDEKAAQTLAAASEAHHNHRRTQLAEMVEYAESDACRRRLLLDHFGDPDPAEAIDCCDNCRRRRGSQGLSPSADGPHLSEAERAALHILAALRRLKGVKTPCQLARLLWEDAEVELGTDARGPEGRRQKAEGSRDGQTASLPALHPSELPSAFCLLPSDPGAWRLARVSLLEVEWLIGQLVRQEYLAVRDGRWPAVTLTYRGEAALEGRPPILLHLPLCAERAAGGTVALTAQMFSQGLAPLQIAFLRGLSEAAVCGHLARWLDGGAAAPQAPVPDALAERARVALGQVDPSRSADPIADFLSRPHPRPLIGDWDAGWALGMNSRFSRGRWNRSQVGGLTYRLKYEGDLSALEPLVAQAMALCRRDAGLSEIDALLPVPPSTPRLSEPVRAFADALGAQLGRPVWPILVKTRTTAPQKEMHSLAQKLSNTAGAFALEGAVSGKRLLVVDDLYDSGATLAEITTLLRRAGVESVAVLTLTRTIHADD